MAAQTQPPTLTEAPPERERIVVRTPGAIITLPVLTEPATEDQMVRVILVAREFYEATRPAVTGTNIDIKA
jgi:hypothetical protein